MPGSLMLFLVIFLLVAWFLIIERQSPFDKIFIILAVAVIFATYRVLTGIPTSQIFTPVINFFK